MKHILFGVFSLIAFFGFLGATSTAHAATNVSGVIGADTVWTASSSPYIATDKITVPTGVTLTLEKGVVVKLRTKGIQVDGALVVQGEGDALVYFTAWNDDTVGGDSNVDGSATVPAPAVWQGIQFGTGAVGTFSNTEFRYTGFSSAGVSGVRLISTLHNLGGNVTINNSKFKSGSSCAVGQTAGEVALSNSQTINMVCGVVALGGKVVLQGNTIQSSNTGFFVSGADVLELRNNTFTGAVTTADINVGPLTSFINEGNTAQGGSSAGMIVRGVLARDLRLAQDTMPYIISGNGGSRGLGGFSIVTDGNLTVNAGSTLTIEKGAVVKFTDTARLIVSGALVTEGAQDEKVYFTSLKDDAVGGDTNSDGGTTVPARGDWNQVQFNSGSQGTLSHTVLRYGGRTVTGGSTSNVYNNGGTLAITNSELAFGGQYGLYHANGTSSVNQSHIHDNPRYGVFNTTQKNIDATNNFWDDATGPNHWITNPAGTGDAVSDKVLYAPWKTVLCFVNCNSSVLFLPGIMGSRLYEESDACASGVSEQERWFSISDCDQLRLKTNVAGESINDIYTKAGNESVIAEAYRFNLYKTFLGALQTWKGTDIISDYKAVPYDWRLRLDDILKAKRDTTTNQVRYDVASTVEEGYLYKTLEELAASSSSGKVTIVAHSNGGLVAKRLLAHLKITNDSLLAKIDNLILVGVPQVGTPSTLLGLLHGDEIGIAGVVVSQQTTRELMNTMPFAFHLLPNQSYFSGGGVSASTPAINFESGSLTTPWANTYGASVTTADALKTFLSTESGRTKPSVSDLETPEVLDTVLFNYAETTDILLNNWMPPNSLKVYQIAGVGLLTQSGINYFTDSKCVARDVLKLFKCTAYEPKLGMRPNETIDGDETVVVPSALAMSTTTQNVERWWLNLESYNSQNFDRRHKDIFEVQDVINFVQNTLQATTTAPYEYLTSTPAVLPPEQRLVFNLHSPLDLKVVASGGKEVSSSTETIEGGIYKRFGEMQHITIPDTGTPVTLKLQGTAYGSFTLEVEEYSGATLDKRHTYSAIPSSTSTEVSMVLSGTTPIEELPLVVDYDGNGTPEISYDTEGEIVTEITYTTLFDALNALTIKPLYKKLLLENAKIAKQFYEKSLTQPTYKKKELFALNVLKQQILLYERLQVLTALQKQELVRIVEGLISK